MPDVDIARFVILILHKFVFWSSCVQLFIAWLFGPFWDSKSFVNDYFQFLLLYLDEPMYTGFGLIQFINGPLPIFF